MADVIQSNLPQHSTPVVLASYKPRVQKRPGTVHEWTEFVNVLEKFGGELYRDARILIAKRREMQQAKPGSRAQRDADHDFHAVLRRATEHAQNMSNAFLTTGMPREHLENHLEQVGTERERRPSYGIALLYSKLMGIPFREERISVVDTPEGQKTERIVEEKTYHWARELKPNEVDDFYRTMRAFNEVFPPLAGKFRRGEIRL